MPLTYNQTQYSTLTVTGTSPNQEATISFSTLDFRPEIGDTIEVYNDTTKLTETTNYTLDTSLKNVVLKVNTFTPGTTISIYRIAKKDTRSIDFQNASVLTEADLDNSAFQTFHIAQEALDTAESSITADADGTFDAGSKRIKNVGTPSADSDAATKSYADGGAAGQSILANESSIAKIGAGYDGTASTSGTNTNLTQINAVANNAVNINAVANDAVDIGAVAGKATEIGLLGTSAMATATTGHIPVLANVVEQTVNYTVTVANNGGNKFHIQGGEYGSATSNPALTLIRGYTYVFDVSDSSVATHPLVFMNGGSTLGTSDGVTTTGTAGQAGAKVTVVVSDSVTITKYSCSAHGDGMGNTITLRHDDFKEVADNATNITSVANNATNINTVAGNNTNINTVAGISANVTTVASNDSNITSVAGNATNINTVATNATNVNNVGSNITSVNSVATNISQVTTFADTYHTAGTTEPSGSNVTEGDLWFDTANDVLKVYDGSSWASASSSIATVASQNEFTASNGQGTGNKYFALNHDVGLELVFLNGVRLKRGSDYYCTNSNTSTTPIASGNAATFVRLETVPGSSDILSVMAFGQVGNNLAVNTAGGTFTGGVTFEAGTTHNTGNNTFTMPTTRGTDGYVLTRDDSVGTGGTAWKETISAPSITNISGEINEDTNTTLTVTGANFAPGMSIKLINSSSGADITGHTTLSYTGSSSPLTVTIPSATQNNTALGVNTSITAGLSVKLHINKQGLTTTSSQSIVVSEDPNWVTNAGNIATILSNTGTGVNVGSALSATAGAGGGTINYIIDTSDTSATTYFDLGLTSGQITTDASNALSGLIGSANSATETFIAYAQIAGEEATKKTPRTFNIIVNKPPIGGTIIEPANYNGNYRSHKFLNAGNGSSTNNFVLYAPTVCDILMVGGGGGGGYDQEGDGGGGGAGGMRVITSTTLSAGTYTISVGAGGDGGSSPSVGGDTTMTGQTASAGGGYGGSQPSSPGANGGSGGGGGGETNTSGGTGAGSLGTNGNNAGYYGGDGGTGNDVAGASRGGAGGGGASQDGGDADSTNGGHGGEGLQNNFETGNAQWYAAGGSGGHKNLSNTAGPVINGISGKGGDNYATSGSGAPTAGQDGTGAGGGGGYGTTAGQNSGGDGVVIIRYAI